MSDDILERSIEQSWCKNISYWIMGTINCGVILDIKNLCRMSFSFQFAPVKLVSLKFACEKFIIRNSFLFEVVFRKFDVEIVSECEKCYVSFELNQNGLA